MQRLLPAAQSSEAEAETSLELPGRSAIATLDEGTTALIDGDGVVVEVEGGVVEAEFDQCSVGIAAVDAPAFGLAGVEEGHLLAVTARPQSAAQPTRREGRKRERSPSRMGWANFTVSSEPTWSTSISWKRSRSWRSEPLSLNLSRLVLV